MQTLTYSGMSRLLLGAVASIRANHQHLSRLDSATGDGDHGTAMLRSMEAIEKAAREAGGSSPKDLLFQAGWEVMSAAGGATGPLLGSFLMGLSEGFGDAAELDAAGAAGAFEKALAAVRKQSKAQPGDKTMLDAMIPAVEAFRAAVDGSADIARALQEAAAAAGAGAEATRNMLAKFGKARNLGDRTLGHADPGATSIACIFQGFVDGITSP